MKISKIIAPGETIIYQPRLSKWAYLHLGRLVRNLTTTIFVSDKRAPSRAPAPQHPPCSFFCFFEIISSKYPIFASTSAEMCIVLTFFRT